MLGFPYLIAKSTMIFSLPIFLLSFSAWLLVKYNSGDSFESFLHIFLYALAVLEGLKVNMIRFRITCHKIGFTSITLLSDKNSFKYFLISHQLVEFGVPRLIIRTPVLPNFTSGWFLSIKIPIKFY